MSVPDKAPLALSENLLTLLSQSDEHGRLVAAVIDPALFDGELRNVAERCVGYWRQHGEAPKTHTADLFSDILEDKHNRRANTYRRILSSMVQLHDEGINSKYVLESARRFMRLQKLKDAILKAAQQLQQPKDTTIEQVEAILDDIMRARDFQFNPGIRLDDFERLLTFLETQYKEFDTGIAALDRQQAVPARGEVWLLLGGTGRGKTWCMIHLGKRALLRRKKVLHITPEISGELTLQRYYQSLFTVTRRASDKVNVARFEKDARQIINITREALEPEFDFESRSLRYELETRVGLMGSKMSNIMIKQVAPRSLSVSGLRGFLDSLEKAENFIPDLLIVDSVYLLKPQGTERRISLGQNMEDLRAVAVDRHMAVVASHQLSKEGAEARVPTMANIGEDWSMAQTADVVIIHAATNQEKRYGLARLYADKVRSSRDKFACLITQAYDVGQYCLESYPLQKSYWDMELDFEEDEEEE